MAFIKRKEDKAFKWNEDLVIVEYREGGQLYLVENPQNITVSFDDYVAVTFTKEEGDASMPYSICKVIGFMNEAFLDVANFLNYNLDNLEFKPRYHQEVIVKNITRDDGQQGAVVYGAGGKSSGEVGLGKDKPKDTPKDDKTPGRGVNEAEDVWKDVPFQAKKEKSSIESLLEQGKIFDFIKKVEH